MGRICDLCVNRRAKHHSETCTHPSAMFVNVAHRELGEVILCADKNLVHECQSLASNVRAEAYPKLPGLQADYFNWIDNKG